MNEYRYNDQTSELHKFDKDLNAYAFAYQAKDGATKSEAIADFEGSVSKVITSPTDNLGFDESTEQFISDPFHCSTNFGEYSAISVRRYEDKNGLICLKIDDAYKDAEQFFSKLYFKNSESMWEFFIELTSDQEVNDNSLTVLNAVLELTSNL